VIEGSLRQAGAKLRLTVQLADTVYPDLRCGLLLPLHVLMRLFGLGAMDELGALHWTPNLDETALGIDMLIHLYGESLPRFAGLLLNALSNRSSMVNSYSILNTRIGSVDAARRAGTIAAIVAAIRSSSTLAPTANGSMAGV
jgi:hypothetical protein